MAKFILTNQTGAREMISNNLAQEKYCRKYNKLLFKALKDRGLITSDDMPDELYFVGDLNKELLETLEQIKTEVKKKLNAR